MSYQEHIESVCKSLKRYSTEYGIPLEEMQLLKNHLELIVKDITDEMNIVTNKTQ